MAPLGITGSILCAALLCLGTSSSISAQDARSLQSSYSLKEWKTAEEITFNGSVRDVVANGPTGSPVGLNLLINGPMATLYVNAGPNLDNAAKQALTPGQSIQVVGVTRTINGQTWILAREIQVGDQKIEVRNQHGFLSHTSVPFGTRAVRSQSNRIGGAQ